MKAISHIRNYSLVILTDVKEILGSGQERPLVPLYTAVFKQGDLTAEELAFAERLYGTQAHGRTYETDEVTPITLLQRLSSYDTSDPIVQADFDTIDRTMEGLEHSSLTRGSVWRYGYMQELTEATLLQRSINSDVFAIFEETPLAPPWPTYDTFPGDEQDLLEVLMEQGHHLPAVLAYELQSKQHPGLVGLLEEQLENLPQPLPGEYVAS